MTFDYSSYLQAEVTEDLKEKIVNHKKRFITLFKARYLEMMPSLIKYQNSERLDIDFLKVEVALRNGYNIAIGETSNGKLQVIGFVTSGDTPTDPTRLWNTKPLTKNDISFIIPKHLQCEFYKEISFYDSCRTGNFTILKNKSISYVNDYEILVHYVDELAEIVQSRYSIAMQVKITTLFLSEPNDETLTKVINDIYNGMPYIKGSLLFDPNEQIYHMQNNGIAQNFQELKREYQNKISELNTMLGIQSLAVEKSSGVSDEEAKSNRGYTTSNANIYLEARNHGLQKLNRRYGLQLEAMYNDEVVSEFEELYQEQEKEKNEGGESSDNNIVSDNPK